MSDEVDLMQESLPDEFSDRCGNIQSILGLAIRKLLVEASEDSLLDKPFGREMEPQPVMTEEEFMKTKDDLNDDPEFNFVYGFNPLKRLANYVRRFHPENVIARREEREKCMKQLSSRASHAKKQMRSVRDLHMISSNSLGGILYGPYVVVLSSTSAVAICRATEPNSIVVLDVSYDDTFTTCISSQESVVEIEKGLVVTFSLTSLKEGCKFYVRCRCKKDEIVEEGAVIDTPSTEEKVVEKSETIAVEGEGETTETPTTEGDTEGKTTEEVTKSVKEIKTKDKITVNHQTTFWTFPSTDPVPIPTALQVDASASGSTGNVEAIEVAVDAAASNEEVVNADGKTNTEVNGNGSVAKESTEEVEAAATEDLNSQVSQTSPILEKAVTFLGLSPGQGRYNERPEAPLNEIISNPNEMCFTCLLGDVFSMASPQHVNDVEWYKSRSAAYFLKESYFMNSEAPTRSSGLLVAWNDYQIGSDLALQAEEIVYKQYQHDLRHWKKKYKNDKQNGSSKKKSSKHQKEVPPEPTLNRPPMSPSLSGLTGVLPVTVYEEATRHTYRTFYIGSQIQVFSLDLRRGFLGKTQAKWLTSGLVKSPCAWKIVLAGASFGVINDLPEVIDEAAIGDVAIPVDSTNNTNTSERDTKVVQIASEVDKAQDKGDFGFSTVSIEHVMCHVQALLLDRKDREAAAAAAAAEAEAEANNEANATGEINTDENSEINDNTIENEATSDVQESSVMSGVNKESASASAVEEVVDTEVSTSNSTSTASSFIESGIVLLTGGSPTAYVTSIDPLQTGDIFAVEVGTGTTTATNTNTNSKTNPESSSSLILNEDLNVSLLYAMTESNSPSMGTIRVSPAGALEVSVIDAVDSSTKYCRQFKTNIEFNI